MLEISVLHDPLRNPWRDNQRGNAKSHAIELEAWHLEGGVIVWIWRVLTVRVGCGPRCDVFIKTTYLIVRDDKCRLIEQRFIGCECLVPDTTHATALAA